MCYISLSITLDFWFQSLQLERLAMYHDSDSVPWKTNKGWEELAPEEWVEVCFNALIVLASVLFLFHALTFGVV